MSNNIIVKESLSFSQAVNAAANKVFQFSGRSRRSEYWWTMLCVYIVTFLVAPIGLLLNLATIPLTFRRLHDTGRSGWWWGIGAILRVVFWGFLIYDLTMYFVNEDNFNGNEDQMFLALLAKYSIFLLIILIYKIVLLIFLCLDSEQCENDYGPSPKYVEEAVNGENG